MEFFDSSAPDTTNWTNIWAALKGKMFNAHPSWDTIIPFSLWTIWLSRNDMVFNSNNSIHNSNHVIFSTTEYQHIILDIVEPKGDQIIIQVKWNLSQPNNYTLNTDGAADQNIRTGDIGGIIRDYHNN